MTKEEQQRIISKNLKSLIEQSGKTQKAIALDTGFSVTRFGNWCTGKATPKFHAIRKLADYFGVDVTAITDEAPDYRVIKLESEHEAALLQMFRSLNDEGKMKMLGNADDLIQSQKYRRE